jgi:hypothetical protein
MEKEREGVEYFRKICGYFTTTANKKTRKTTFLNYSATAWKMPNPSDARFFKDDNAVTLMASGSLLISKSTVVHVVGFVLELPDFFREFGGYDRGCS